MLKSSNIDQDRNLYPLLVSDLRFQTISKYLSLELFAYPEFRKYLKDKYSKKLMVSTTPTKKGQHNIDLYSCYFPVKRINAKPLSTLKRELWILALQAKKHDLINLELMFDWEVLIPADKDRTVERDHKDTVYNEIIKYYFDITTHKSGDSWNLFRKRVIHRTLDTYFFPAFWK